MDLSEAFRTFYYELLLAKLAVYGFDRDFLNFKVI